jgi:beta-N-acetylhexosaminidase
MAPRSVRDPAPRRRLLALVAVAATALVAGIVAGAGSGGDGGGKVAPTERPRQSRERAAVDRLGLRRQVGQVLVGAFPGTSEPAYLRRLLGSGELAGVVLFGGNAPSPGVVRTLTGAIQRSARGSALVATDQEGGDVRILRFAGPQEAQTATATPAAALTRARAAGRALKAAGVNVSLAPVADVARGGALAGRSFPGAPPAVGRTAAAAVRGWRAGGVGATVKHFPGLGRARSNTDDAGVTIPGRLGSDLVPFRAAIGAGAPLVMASHGLYPAYDRSRIASQSPAILGGLLRRQLGFRGVVVTDSIEAQAVLARSSVAVGAERSLTAGADLVLMTGSGSYKVVYPKLLGDARRSPRLRARIREAAARVLALKRRLGLRPPSVGAQPGR